MSQSVRAVQVLSDEALQRAEVEIRILEQRERDLDGHLTRGDDRRLKALRRACEGYIKVSGVGLVRIRNLEGIIEFSQAAMDANSSVPGQLNVLPASFASTFADFQHWIETLGLRFVEIGMTWDPSRITRKDEVEKLLAQATADPGPSPVAEIISAAAGSPHPVTKFVGRRR